MFSAVLKRNVREMSQETLQIKLENLTGYDQEPSSGGRVTNDKRCNFIFTNIKYYISQ